MLVAFIAFLIAVGLSVGFSVLISQPFSGAIVRLRANYLPKAISLDNVLEDGGASGSPRAISAFLLSERRSTAKIGPVITGVFSMLKRTKRLEGWAGVYKGSAPVALQLVLLSFLTFIFFSVESAWSAGSTYKAAPSAPGEFGFFTNLLFMVVTSLVALPLNVITYRTIVHPRILPWNKPRENLKELLSYSEYAQPWRLYQLPGLLAANFAHVAWIGLATRIVRQLTVPALGGLDRAQPAAPGQDTYEGPNSKMLEISSFGLAVFVSWNVLSVVVLAPLECVMVRLSTQRPERQNPLHRAYARVPNSASGAGSSAPAPYSHQATVSAQTQPGGAYTDAEVQNQAGRRSTDKPLPSSPDGADEPSRPRPSFAIEDDEDEDESPRQDGEQQKDRPSTGSSAKAARVLGGLPSDQQDSRPPAPSYSAPQLLGGEPKEPVIALRPIEEPQSAEEAAAEFGAPVVERYEGLVDCVRKMMDEEGVESLGRGAWVTLLGVFAGSFS